MSKKGYKHSKESRLKMSLNNGNKFGHPQNEETREKIRKYRLGKKHPKEVLEKMSRSNSKENNWNWQGGKSFEVYSIDWTKTLRTSIRERDKYTCQICGLTQGDKAFAVHHIDYDKKNCNPLNLITLCIRCHTKTNQNRKKWIKFFGR